MRINLPTWLTLFRVLLLPVMVIVYYLPFRGANLTAALVFVLAGFTDWLDGYLARRLQLTSAFGAFLDPVADKLMVAVTLFLLVQSHPGGGWSSILMAVTASVIVGREISVSALREWMAQNGAGAGGDCVVVHIAGGVDVDVAHLAVGADGGTPVRYPRLRVGCDGSGTG